MRLMTPRLLTWCRRDISGRPESDQGLSLGLIGGGKGWHSAPTGPLGGKIAAMRAQIAVIAMVLATLPLGACGGPQPPTCGTAGGPPHPEIAGEIIYYCRDWPRVNGGLYVLDVASGRVRALTADLAWNLDGAWSPDGTRIAFQSTREGRDDIFVMNADGNGVRKLTDGRGWNEYPSWSPDGQWITFNSSRDGIAGSGETGYYRDLYLMRADGSGIRRLTRHAGSNNFAAWRPDGRSLAFQSDRAGPWDVYTMELDGSSLQRLTHGGGGFPRWSSDGSRIVFERGTSGGPQSIYWLTVGQDELHRITFGESVPPGDILPDWSPDGRWIVFTRSRSGDAQLFAVRPDGSGLTQLTDGLGYKDLPRWRPI